MCGGGGGGVNKGVRLLPLNQDQRYTVRSYLICGKCVCVWGGGGGGGEGGLH